MTGHGNHTLQCYQSVKKHGHSLARHLSKGPVPLPFMGALANKMLCRRLGEVERAEATSTPTCAHSKSTQLRASRLTIT